MQRDHEPPDHGPPDYDGPPEYDDAPPSWTDADAGSAAGTPKPSSEAGAKRPRRAGSHDAQRTSGLGGEAKPLALIEEVFPGKIMEFTAAPDAAGEGDGEADPGDPADPDAFTPEPEENDD